MTEEGFSPEWLALREPTDHRSRSTRLVSLLRDEWRARGWTRLLDLGSGTGSNVRYLAPRLPGRQEWTLIDHDADLLSRVDEPGGRHAVSRVVGDLDRDGLAAVGHTDLVTCAALLDLVTEDWLRRLVHACAAAACGAYLVLSYDGSIDWSAAGSDGPEDADDTMIREAVNDHQRRDRGPDTALGPTASAAAEALFAAAGYRTWVMPSPWRLGPEDAELTRALIDGWEHAALDLGGRADRERRVREWATHRRETTTGEFELTVGHQDLLALPA
jgi:SAM-dependent methyltransferase